VRRLRRNSGHLTRDNAVAAGDWDEGYALDSLNRLTQMRRGTLADGSIGTEKRQEDWTLDQAGNWAGYDVEVDDADTLNQTRKHNRVNEIYDAFDAISEGSGQSQWADPVYDPRSNAITLPKPSDPAHTYSCTYDACAGTSPDGEPPGHGRRRRERLHRGLLRVRRPGAAVPWEVYVRPGGMMSVRRGMGSVIDRGSYMPSR